MLGPYFFQFSDALVKKENDIMPLLS
jgi:hypothetical protein